LTIGSSGAEAFCPSSQTRAQLLRHVVILGRRTIRWLLSPRSISAPTVRPTLVFLHRRFIRRYTDALVPPVITVRRRFSSLTLTRAARAHPHRPPPVHLPSPPPTTIRVRKPPRRPSAVPRARRRLPRLYTASKSACARCRHPPRVWPPPWIPTKRRHLGSPALTGECARLQTSSTAVHCCPFLRCGEAFTGFPLPLHLGLLLHCL
jgi:hypothetical protein